jgi:hypothetical protein
MTPTPQADRIAHAGLPPDAFIGQMTALARELEAKCINQAERIRQLEGATNHAGGTPLSQWRECAELLAELAQHPREGDEFIKDYVELRATAMGAFRKLKEASK